MIKNGKHHLIISGTGRAGTTFLVQLLTDLGLDTGFSDPRSGVFPNCDAGMEWDLRRTDAPYIVKSPHLCGELDQIIKDCRLTIDHAIVPMRSLYGAAESRRHVMARSDVNAWAGEVPGGLWLTDDPREQETVLSKQFYTLFETLARHTIPITLLSFPRIVHDPAYLFGRIEFALNGASYERFLAAFHATVRPQLVHDFSTQDSQDAMFA
jgi:hypothetical protein